MTDRKFAALQAKDVSHEWLVPCDRGSKHIVFPLKWPGSLFLQGSSYRVWRHQTWVTPDGPLEFCSQYWDFDVDYANRRRISDVFTGLMNPGLRSEQHWNEDKVPRQNRFEVLALSSYYRMTSDKWLRFRICPLSASKWYTKFHGAVRLDVVKLARLAIDIGITCLLIGEKIQWSVSLWTGLVAPPRWWWPKRESG